METERSSPKYVFDLEGAYLRDSFLDEGERRVVLMPRATLDDYLRYPPPGASPEHSDRELEELLEHSAAGRPAVAQPLMRYLSDPRVRPALLSLCMSAHPSRLRSVATALGKAGGAGAREALRSRLVELSGRSEPFLEDSFFNEEGAALCELSIALLRLDPESEEAANCLARLFAHPTLLNRQGSLRGTAELLKPTGVVRTRPYEFLREQLTTVAASDDPDSFVGCAPLLLDDWHLRPAAVDRMRTILAGSKLSLRRAALNCLVSSGKAEAMSLARDHLGVETSIHLRLSVAQGIAGLLEPQERLRLIRQAMQASSPSARLGAIPLLAGVKEPGVASDCVRAAAVDEPDEFLRGLFREFSERFERSQRSE